MSSLWAIAQREWASFFRLPVGWVVIALYMLVTGVVFDATIRSGEPATMRDFFSIAAGLMVVVCPAISMRLVSEELRTGTLETMMTSPVGDFTLASGKYTGGCLFLATMLLPSLTYVGLLWLLSDRPPDIGPILAGYLSLALVGMTYLAVGTLASAFTSSQTLAFLGTFLALLIILLGPDLLVSAAPAWAAEGVRSLSIRARVEDFARGVIDTAHLAFFLGFAAWFVVLAYLVIGSRRWR